MQSITKIFISLVLWQIASSHEVCHDTDFSFNGKDEYLEHVGTLPEMTAFTVCDYVTTNADRFVEGTIGNYATDTQPKSIVAKGLKWDGKRGFQVIVNGKGKKIETPLQANTEYHVCTAMNMVDGKMDLYLNGHFTRTLKFNIKNGKIRGGGKITLGKAQFEDGTMMKGRLRNFIVWGKKLTAEEISEVYNENECPEGAVMHLDLDHVIPHGLNFQTNGKFSECHSSDFNITYDGVTEDHIQFLDTIPDLEYITTCAWITTNDKKIIPGTIGGYFVDGQTDAVLVEGINVLGIPSLRVIINGEAGIISTNFEANTEYYVCIQFFVPDNRIQIYVDGVKRKSIDYTNLGGKVLGGGKLILGQRQECSGGCFTRKRAYSGRIRNFMFWMRLLSVAEMKQIATSNICPTDTLLDSGTSRIIDRTKRECIQTEHTLDNTGDKTQYIEVHGSLPELEYATVCFRITPTSDGTIPGTIVSYAHGNRTILSIGGEMTPGGPTIRYELDGEVHFQPIPISGGLEYGICVTFNFKHGSSTIYLNLFVVGSVKYKKTTSLTAGGQLIIGQLQGCEGGCFDRSRAFTGTIRNFQMWGRVLFLVEIVNLSKDVPICTNDALARLTTENIHFHHHAECVLTEFTLNNREGATEYVEVEKTLPELDYATACNWMTTNQYGAIPGTVASYVLGDRTIMSIGGEMGAEGAMLRFEVDGEVKLEKGQFLPNTEYSVCAAFHFKDGFLRTFINGRMVREVKFAKGTTSPTGGKLVIGQLQTCEDECFDETRAYTGTIRYFTVWGRILSDDDIMEYAENPPHCEQDAIIELTPDVAEFHSHAACPASEFPLNNKEDVAEYVEARQTLPELNYMTICVKVTTNSIGMLDGTVVSYAVGGKVDVVVLSGELGADKKPKIRVIVNGESVVIPGKYEANTEYLFCFVYHLLENMVKMHVQGDGTPNSMTQMDFPELGKIPGGGKLVLGQRQGCLGGCFVKEGFTGKIKNFVIWDRILDSEHMHEILDEDECPTGHILDLAIGNYNLGTVMK